ncbi:MAG: SUMF1/EgtB/PvdO family nonheme iron enzyme [Muribaculaceae bacterium]|nr:SUMF1/EgtB/PvdO family nonheme iron enzyme [Muribaculaceae bacterium]
MNQNGNVDIDDLNAIINLMLGKGTNWHDDITTYKVNGVEFKMVKVEGGTFTMGATPEQGSDADSDEYPAHQVTLSTYSIGETEVTQALWLAVMGSNPSYWTGNLQLPVEYVTWDDCQTFLTKLNQLTGQNFRLPTEAEWEYAARGGNKSQGYKYPGSNDANEVAWYSGNTSSTHPIAQKKPNELGLYDMAGNVEEYCYDWYGSYSSVAQVNPTGPATGSIHVDRGSSYYSPRIDCRVSRRDNGNSATGHPTGPDPDLGLRLVK